MIIDLNGFDLQYVAMVAERRHVVKMATRAKSNKYDDTKGEFELHYVGAMGEFGVSKDQGVPMDERVHRGGDDGVDFVINGYECHVKTLTYTGPNPEFFVNDMDHFTARVGIGARILSPTRVEVIGCISRKTFAKNAVERDYGHGPRLAVPYHLLQSLDVLHERTEETDSC